MLSCSCSYLFLFASFLIYSASSKTISYNDHCSSIVPQSNLTIPTNFLSIPTDLYVTDFTGGDGLLLRNPAYAYPGKSLELRIVHDYYQTEDTDIYQVRGIVKIRKPYSDDEGVRPNDTSIKFIMKGFLSENSRKLCMVGSASIGKIINFDAVLKLKYATDINPTIYTSVVSGTLESTVSQKNDARYFDPISIFSFPPNPHYNYSTVSNEISKPISSDYDQSLKFEPKDICSVIGWRSISLELNCREDCSPPGSSAQVLILTPIGQCFDGDTKFRFKAKFQNISYEYDGSFNPESTLIAEAAWDDKKNVLLGVACRLLDPLTHFGDAVGDCTFRLTLRYPSILTIRNESKIVGQIWSSKSGFFNKIDLISSDDRVVVVPFPGPKYEFTEMDRVRKSCEKKAVKKKGSIYPDGLSHYMRLDMLIKNSKGDLSWGYATPIFVGNYSYQNNDNVLAVSPPVNISPVNISYKIIINPIYQHNSSSWIPILNMPMNLRNETEVTAEGIYNALTGDLCMVGCRKMVKNSTISNDCEILVKLQFPPFDARFGLITGAIESMRAKSDPLYFDELLIQSAAIYTEVAQESTWRMDLETMLVGVLNALACIFIGLQIFRVKRKPSVISVIMSLLLSVGYTIPLMLNFEDVLLINGGKVEANEVIVVVIIMVALLLQIRLLQLVWTSKDSNINENKGEKKGRFFSLGLYILGGVATFLLNWTKNGFVPQGMYSLLGDLRSYADLVVNGFLLPQILLNVFVGSTKKALSRSFYMGTSAVLLAPHAYNQYRLHNYSKFDANPAADFYSTTWDIVTLCGVILLVVVVFFHQLYVLPKRFKGLEKVPAVESCG